MHDHEIIEMPDLDPDDPMLDILTKPMIAYETLETSFVISPKGDFLRIENWDRILELHRELDEKAEAAAKVLDLGGAFQMNREPPKREVYERNAAKVWGFWVSNWRNLLLKRGTPKSLDFRFPRPGGGESIVKGTVTYLLPDESDPEAHRLEVKIVRTGPEFMEDIFHQAQGLDKEAVEKMMKLTVGEISKTTEVRLTTDPTNLLPTYVEISTLTDLTGIGAFPPKQKHEKAYRITWE